MDGKEGMRMDRKRAQMQDHREALHEGKLLMEGALVEQTRKSWQMSGWIVEPLSSSLRKRKT